MSVTEGQIGAVHMAAGREINDLCCGGRVAGLCTSAGGSKHRVVHGVNVLVCQAKSLGRPNNLREPGVSAPYALGGAGGARQPVSSPEHTTQRVASNSLPPCSSHRNAGFVRRTAEESRRVPNEIPKWAGHKILICIPIRAVSARKIQRPTHPIGAKHSFRYEGRVRARKQNIIILH